MVPMIGKAVNALEATKTLTMFVFLLTTANHFGIRD
jgi:hypothetical protein